MQFHFILNVAVGGVYFTEGCTNIPFNKPWSRNDTIQMKPFWEVKDQWLPTWNATTEDNAMKIDYIRVYSFHWFGNESDIVIDAETCFRSYFSLYWFLMVTHRSFVSVKNNSFTYKFNTFRFISVIQLFPFRRGM